MHLAPTCLTQRPRRLSQLGPFREKDRLLAAAKVIKKHFVKIFSIVQKIFISD